MSRDTAPHAAPYAALVAHELISPTAWQAVLRQLPNPHPLQTIAWGEVKERWGWQMTPTVWTTPDGDPLAAALLLRRPIPRTPLRILYVPKGPLLDYHNAPLRRAVFDRLQTMARNERAILIKIDPDVALAWGEEPTPDPLGQAVTADLAARGWRFSAEQIQFRNTVLLDLRQSEEALLASFKPKTRYNIRLAERKGVTVRRGDPADFAAIAEMYAATGERQAFAVRPRDYYLDVWRTFYQAGMLEPLLAEYEGTLLAAVMLVRFGRLALYMYGASAEHERQRMPTYLLQWEAIRRAQQLGCAVYDMWGAPDQFDESDRLWGVWRFKQGFNGVVARHIGAWDYPVFPRLYRLYGEALPRYLTLLKQRR